jgi:hypothetical protein
MITGAPLPSWTELAALAGLRAAPAAEPAGLWAGPGERSAWFSRSAHALAAIVRDWSRRHGRPPRLWVPDYFCNASLDPARRLGVALTFHPIGSDLRPDWETCAALASRQPPDLLLAVHYFGLAADMAAALAFCRRTGALLIEDCAHALAPTAEIGRSGDFVLWSPHKLLPVPHGSLLVCRTPGLDLPSAEGAAPSIRGWLIKRLVQKLAPGGLLPPAAGRGPARFEDDPPEGTASDTPAAAGAALRLLAAAASDLDRVAAARRANAAELLARLEMQDGWHPLFDPAATTPYRLVMVCDTAETAAGRYDLYRKRNVVVESWPDLAPEVRVDGITHAGALVLRNRLLCFAVHQRI